MEVTSLKAQPRPLKGSKHCRRLRSNGQLPAIIYGHGEDPLSVALNAHDVEVVLQHHSRVVQLGIDGDRSQCLIKAVQYDHLGSTPVHLDLMRVYADERVTVEVEIELKGTPKGAHEGGVLTQILNTVEVECPVTSIPESFRLSVVDLDINDSLSVSDLKPAEGVKILADPDDKIVIVRVPTVVEEEPEAEEEAAEASTEPEVIGKSKEEEESSE